MRRASSQCPNLGLVDADASHHLEGGPLEGMGLEQMAAKILIVVHGAHSTPGRVGELLAERGYSFDRRCTNLFDPLPVELSGYAAAIVFGGPQSANDDDRPAIRMELDWLERVALPSDRPLLGICLGAQMIARVLGAKVGRHPEGLVEIGYHPVYPTAAGQAYFDGATMFYQWHRETFEIPSDAVHLAHNDAFDAQAFRYREQVYGIEFHPEMTRAMVERWSGSDRGGAMLTLPGAQPRDQQLEDYDRYAPASDRWLGRFLDGWLRLDRAGRGS
jgi:GMP synthase (glutamine-hydrolysing)